MKKCPFCGAEINKNAVICVHCGASFEAAETTVIEKDIKLCPNCHNKCYKDAVICVNCGQLLKNKGTSKKQSSKNSIENKILAAFEIIFAVLSIVGLFIDCFSKHIPIFEYKYDFLHTSWKSFYEASSFISDSCIIILIALLAMIIIINILKLFNINIKTMKRLNILTSGICVFAIVFYVIMSLNILQGLDDLFTTYIIKFSFMFYVELVFLCILVVTSVLSLCLQKKK